MGTRWGIYWGPVFQAMSKKPLAVGEIVSLLPAVMLKAPADSVAYASSFFAPADAPEHQITANLMPAIVPAFADQNTPMLVVLKRY
jgi:hypothetical protein